ncbi:MAG TPA: histidine phosphatase family protein [Thermoanaerobaculia bacterium]|nr:histidine phosphatase family protein [Thermoanaerobaculia bacterium]
MAVILVRHPETVDPRLISGHSDVAVAPHALATLDSLAASLPRVRHIVSSDLSRCRVLAEAVAAQRGVECIYDVRWREQTFGAWDGKRWDEVDGREYLEQWITATPPGGESIVDVQTRVIAALADAGHDTLVVTHAGPIRCVLAIVCGLSIADAFAVPIPFGSWRSL